MRYVVYGAGGIGGGIGARLFQAGFDVVLICRGAHLEKVRRDGLTLRNPEASVTLTVPAVGHPSEIEWTANDAVLLTMKSQDTAAALEDLRAATGDVPVVCAQNGVANERMALRLFSRVYGMLVFMPAVHLEPADVVMHAATPGGVLDAGRYPAGVDGFVEQVCADLTTAGFLSRPDPDIMRVKYTKLLQNSTNVIQALCGPQTAAGELVARVREEVIAVYEAAGIDYPPLTELSDRSRGVTLGEVAGAPRWGCSTWQSLARGAGSIETDFLNGEIALWGALHGVPTPFNRLLQSLAAVAARERRPPGSYEVEEIMARAEG